MGFPGRRVVPLPVPVMRIVVVLILSLVSPALAVRAQSAPSQPAWMNLSLSANARTSLLMDQMTLQEKIDLVTGDLNNQYGFYNAPIARLGIPALTMADGPAGVRINNQSVNGGKATQMPVPMGLAATFDPDLARQYGNVLGTEAFATGHNVLLGPTVDIARVPLWGRAAEAFGEDPFLQSQMAVPEINAIQSHPVMATAKHVAVYNQEINRFAVDARVGARPLHEIYTLPFRAAVQQGNVGAAMCSFNKVNDVYACENGTLLNKTLRTLYGFQGWVMSDYGANPSTVGSAKNGLDQEQPTAGHWGTNLTAAVNAGQVSTSNINTKVRRILRVMFAHGLFDDQVQISPLPVQQDGLQARKTADAAAVLLKNTGNLLPLSTTGLRSIAVIGADARNGSARIGGSAEVKPTYKVNPFKGIQTRAGASVQVRSAPGTDPVTDAALLSGPAAVPSSLLTPAGGATGAHGLKGQYWTNTTFKGTPALTRTDRQAAINIGFFDYPGFNASSLGGDPTSLDKAISVRWTGKITAPVTGTYTLSLTSRGSSTLYLDGKIRASNPGPHELSTKSVKLSLVGGKSHSIRIDYVANTPNLTAGGLGPQFKLGWTHPANAIPAAMRDAANLAKASDVAVVVVRDYETENGDRPSLTLPNEQNQLIKTVAAANPRTVVVVQTGAPVTMPWLQQTPAVVEAWYGGQEQGNQIADILFGDVNPSGKLPITFPQSMKQSPIKSAKQYPGVNGVETYSEGLRVGYRWYDATGTRPLFPFGYGLSYTTFSFSNLRVTPGGTDTDGVRVEFNVRNTGTRSGAEVAQIYVGLPASAKEPPQRLAGFQRVQLAAGEIQHVVTTLSPQSLSYWSTSDNAWRIASGNYRIFVGGSSRDAALTGTVPLSGAVLPG